MTVEVEDVEIRLVTKNKNPLKKDFMLGYILRFTLLHTFTYAICGIISFIIFSYASLFESSELMSLLMRPMDDPIVQIAIFFQLFRGAILALAFISFKDAIIQHRYGWLQIFVVLFIMTGIGAVITGPGTIEGMIYTNLSFTDHFSPGFIEISIQMLIFSWLIWKWEQRVKNIKKS